jgi:hypothetical protein
MRRFEETALTEEETGFGDCIYRQGLIIIYFANSLLPNTGFVNIKFVWRNTKVSHHRHVYTSFTETIRHTEFVNVCMIYFRIKFQIPISDGSLVVTIKPKGKHRFRSVIMLFHSL